MSSGLERRRKGGRGGEGKQGGDGGKEVRKDARMPSNE
jgi:hypothetical protein